MELDVLTSVGHHPNIVTLLGACIGEKSKPIIIEEYVDGPNLALYFLTNHGKLKERTIYTWIMHLMRATEHLHNRDLVIMHRDLKPGF